MKLALQLTCYNGARYLPYLFASLQRQTCKEWDLYVLDNASSAEDKAGILRAIEQSDLSVVYFRVEENIGFAGGHNYLFARHTQAYDAVQLLNDDAMLEPAFLETCIRYLEQQPFCASTTGTIFRWDFEARDEVGQGKTEVIDSLGITMDWKGFVSDRGAGQHTSALKIPVQPFRVMGVSGCLPMYRLSAVREVSVDGCLFDHTFTIYKEDVDLALRLQAAAYDAVVLPAARAYHRRSFGLKSVSVASVLRPLNDASFYSYRNHLWTLFAHVPWWHLFTFRIGLIPSEIAKMVYWLVRQPAFVKRMLRDTWRERMFLSEKRAFVATLRRLPRHVSDAKRPKVDVAIVMVSHNDLNPDCLTSVKRACDTSSLKTQLVVVDNNSHAYHANELVDEFFPGGMCLLREGDFGFGRSCNLGAQAIEAEYYFFLNPDTKLVDENIISRLYAYLQVHPRAGIVGPKIFYFDGRLQETCRRFPAWYMPFVQRTALAHTPFGKRYADHFAMRDYDHAMEREVDWMQGSALFMRGDVWKKLGGFDDRFFMYFEDIDLCRRTKELGYGVVYYPEATLQHFHGKESARIANFFKNLIYNRIARAHIISWAKYSIKWL